MRQLSDIGIAKKSVGLSSRLRGCAEGARGEGFRFWFSGHRAPQMKKGPQIRGPLEQV
ncbi:MAG TPA: hypothetical protein VM468_13500 [Mycoplana sp.]|nr:hypothetical protein [Mycoplana sp.]